MLVVLAYEIVMQCPLSAAVDTPNVTVDSCSHPIIPANGEYGRHEESDAAV